MVQRGNCKGPSLVFGTWSRNLYQPAYLTRIPRSGASALVAEIFGLTRFLDELSLTQPLPKTIVLDNGPELTSEGDVFMVAKAPGNAAFYSTRKTLTECIRCVIQWPGPRLLPKSAIFLQHR